MSLRTGLWPSFNTSDAEIDDLVRGARTAIVKQIETLFAAQLAGAEDLGRVDRRCGKLKFECPFHVVLLKDAWMRGYDIVSGEVAMTIMGLKPEGAA